MKTILVIGEKTSQVKKFVTVLCKSYKSSKKAKYIYTYTGSCTISNSPYNITFLPLSGHITTLDTRKGYNWGECPPIKIVYDKKAIQIKNKRPYVSILKHEIEGKDEIWLATDPDSEGDNIALEVINILRNKITRKNIRVKRIWNSSLTKFEIIRAFQSPRQWKENLALGVQGRRLIDAWLGFAGTREITRAARKVAKVKVLSVGRVQLPTLYLIVQADLDHEIFVPKNRWKIIALFKTDSIELSADHSSGYLYDKDTVDQILSKLSHAIEGEILKITENQVKKIPPHPLNTTAAVSLLTKVMKISANRALALMVDLYNKGLLSYPRTENKKFKTNFPHKDILSNLLRHTKFIDYIKSIHTTTQVRNNGPKKGEEEDHDPIHPTGELDELNNIDKQHYKAWDILSRYYISLFMDDLVTSKTEIDIQVTDELFYANGRTIINLGWRKPQWWKTTQQKMIPNLQENQSLDIKKIYSDMSQTKPPKRLTDSELILMMEKVNIGTKSSRPDIIQKLEQRKYIIRSKQTLISTMWGRGLIASLKPIWSEVVTPKFTAHVEDLMDQVAKEKKTYQDMIKQLRREYIELHQKLIQNISEYQKLLQQLNLDDQKSSKNKINTSERKYVNNILTKLIK